MTFLLDTDTCSFVMKHRYPSLAERVAMFAPRELKVSVISVYELEFGLERRGRPAALTRVVEGFLKNVEVLPFNPEAARHAGTIRATLAAKGQPIGAYDLLIAGHARSLDATLVTHNLREFGRVPGLAAETWVEPGS